MPDMPDMPDYDKLMLIEDMVNNESSPFYKQLMQAMEPYNQKLQTKAQGIMKAQGGKQLTAEQKSALFKEYQQLGAAKTLEMLQGQFGGKIPDQKEAQEFDYARRVKTLMGSPDFKGTEEEANATVREGEPPYSHAYGIINSLQAMLPQETKVTPQSPAPKIRPTLELTAKAGPDSSDDEKIADAQLLLLKSLVGGDSLPAGPTGPAGPTDEQQLLMRYGR